MKKFSLYFELCKKQKYWIVLGYLLMIVEAILVASLPFLMNKVFDLLFTITKENYTQFIILFLIYILLVGVQFILSYTATVVFKKVGNRNTEEIALIVAEKVYYSRKKTPAQFEVSDILQSLNEDVFSVGESGVTVLYDIIHTCISIISLFIFMAYVNWILAVALVLGFFALTIIQRSINNKAGMLISIGRESSGDYEYVVSNFAQNHHGYRALGCYKYFVDSFGKTIKRLISDRFRVTKLFASSGMISGFWTILNMVVVLLVGARSVISGAITISALVTFNMYSSNLGAYIMGIPEIISSYQEFSVSYKRLIKLCNSEQFANETNGIDSPAKTLSIHHGKFCYTDKLILKDVEYSFESGILYCITGANGSGKTTLIHVLMGEYDLQSGCVKLGDMEIIPQRDRSALMSAISYCSSNTLLFNDKIINNITLGADYNSCDLSKIIEVLNMQDIDINKTIDEMHEIYSAGQLQKIALARSFLSNKKIMILDEFEKHLDRPTQERVLKYLNQEKSNRIIIVISHDENTKSRSDKILFLEDGILNE